MTYLRRLMDTREELFAYEGLILGSVEASFFTSDQLSMIADFVSQRGGGLLTLGGRNALAEGGYGGTAVEEALPVVLEQPASDPRRAYTEVKVTPTLVCTDLALLARKGGFADSHKSTTMNLGAMGSVGKKLADMRIKDGETRLNGEIVDGRVNVRPA